MSLARELAEAFRKALGRQDELRGAERTLVQEQQELLRRESATRGTLADLRAQVAGLERDVESGGQELRELRHRLTHERGLLAATLSDLHDELHHRCESAARHARDRSLRRDVLAARQAFSSDLEELGLREEETSMAQWEAMLPRLAEAAERRRAVAARLATNASEQAQESASRVTAEAELAARRRQLAGREDAAVLKLGAHSLSAQSPPPLALSIAAADLDTLRSLSRHVLEPLLRDLRIERQGSLAKDVDPLDEVRFDLTPSR